MRHQVKVLGAVVVPLKSGAHNISNDCADHSFTCLPSIILLDIAVRLVKDILVFDLILDPNYTAKGLLDLLLAGRCALPAVEADNFHNAVNISNDALYNDRRIFCSSHH